MADLLKGLEGETEESEIIEGDETAIQDAVMEVIEEEAEVVEMEGEIEDMDEADDDFEESYEQLSVLKSAIDEFGLCKPMASALGTTYTALHEGGIVPSLEELNDLPTKGTASMEASKTIGDRLRSAWEAVKRFLKNMWTKLKEMFSRFLGMFMKYETIVKSLKVKLAEGSLDPKKLSDKKTTAIAVENLKGFAGWNDLLIKAIEKSEVSIDKELEKFISDIDKLNKSNADKDAYEKEIKNIEEKWVVFAKSLMQFNGNKKDVGIEVKESNGKYSISTSTPSLIKGEKKTLGELGWDDSKVKAALDTAKDTLVNVKKIQGEIKILDVMFSTVDKAIGSMIASAAKDHPSISVMEKSLKIGKSFLLAKKSILTRAISNANMSVKATVIVARASLSCMKDKK